MVSSEYTFLQLLELHLLTFFLTCFAAMRVIRPSWISKRKGGV